MSGLVSMFYDFSHGNQHICLTKHSFEIIINVEQLCLRCGFVKKKGYASKQHLNQITPIMTIQRVSWFSPTHMDGVSVL